MFPTDKSPQISYKYYCNLCNYKCNKNSEYTKHISTNNTIFKQDKIVLINYILDNYLIINFLTIKLNYKIQL